ncbi:MAG: RNA methyltransferase [Oscillospiraceae bacterium]|jgi:TrmH family RNA methyltransferase|nr:RNA methyltransferase [Oscillospiraceae bacterium]
MEYITSKDNSDIKKVAKLIASKKARDESGLFVCEGLRLCMDGIDSGFAPDAFFMTQDALDKNAGLSQPASRCGKAYVISDAVARKLSDTGATQGVFAVFKKLDNTESAVTIKSGGNYVLLSALQDPGNVGSIVRSCEAFGLDGLVLSADCPDIYSAKVLRASMGGVFRLPIYVCADMAAYIAGLRVKGVTVFAAALTRAARPVMEAGFRSPCAVVIGNEGRGLPADIVAACDASVAIPMPGGAQSLNAGVAAGIIMWEMKKAAGGL